MPTESKPEFSYQISPRLIQPGESVVYEIKYHSPEEATLNESLLTEQEGLTLLEKTHEDIKDEHTIRYRITSYKVGTKNLPPLELQIGSNTYSTESVPIEVSLSTKTENLNEIFKAQNNSHWFWYSTLVLFLIGVAYLIKRFYPLIKKYFQVSTVPQNSYTPFDLSNWVKQELKNIWNLFYKDPTNPQILVYLHLLIRNFGEKVENNPYRAWTNTEMSREAFFKEIIFILNEIDKIKFSLEKQSEEGVKKTLSQSEQWVLKCLNS